LINTLSLQAKQFFTWLDIDYYSEAHARCGCETISSVAKGLLTFEVNGCTESFIHTYSDVVQRQASDMLLHEDQTSGLKDWANVDKTLNIFNR